MTRTSFMVGISALAFAASGASAQINDTTDGNGNRAVQGCVGTSATTCVVQNSVSTDVDNTNNTGSVGSRGTNNSQNSGTVTQFGSRNSGGVDMEGGLNEGRVTQGAAGARANNNSGFIFQQSSNGVNGANNTNNGLISQRNSENSATIRQTRTSTSSADAALNNDSFIYQGVTAGGTAGNGVGNVATSTQNGSALNSTITQNTANAGAASFNTATVTQSGTGSTSTVTQASRGNTAIVNISGGGTAGANGTTGANFSAINQDNFARAADVAATGTAGTAGFTPRNPATSGFQPGANADTFQAGSPTAGASPNTRNVADVAIAGQQNSSTINQNGVQNTAFQTMLNGGSGNTTGGGVSSNPGTNGAIPQDRPQGNISTINQAGRGNYAATSIGGRVTTGGGSGNLSTIVQSQEDPTAGQATANSSISGRIGHRATVFQRGILDSVAIDQSNNTVGNVVQTGSVADVSQLSFNSTASVTQVGSNTAIITQGASRETTGASNVITVSQTDAGELSTTTPGGGGGGVFNPGQPGNTTTTTARNNASLAQSGIQNNMSLTQNAVNANALLFQATGTRSNFITVNQGNGVNATGARTAQTNTNVVGVQGVNAQNLVAIVNQTQGQNGPAGANGAAAQQTGVTSGGTNFTPIGATAAGGAGTLNRGVEISQSGLNLTATANQSGGSATPAGTALGTGNENTGQNNNNAIAIAQTNRNSSATVTQAGTNLGALVEQRGLNGTTALNNLVTINQTGDRQRAIATQTQDSGASEAGSVTAGVPGNDQFPNSRGGAQSAEIRIMQSGTGHSATVEQRGRGQYASIMQSGTGNTGGILQTTAAINAVALLEQTGSGNTFYITQDQAGQYIRVQQMGTGNTMTTITERAPAGSATNGGGTTDFTTPPASFGTVQ